MFKNFSQTHDNGFLLHNCYEYKESFLKHAINNNYFFQQENNSFFFLNKKLLFYFINEIKQYNLKPSFIRLIGNQEKYFEKHQLFLKLNNFKCFQVFKQMILKNENLIPIEFDFIKKPTIDETAECYDFLNNNFEYEFNLFYQKNNFKKHINNILYYKENGKICGVLLYSNILNNAILDYIAVKPNLKYKNVAFALLNHFFLENTKAKFYKLYVDINNTKAIKFYKKSNFKFNKTEIRFYRNFHEL
ncbi:MULTISPECIES: GNAT family N-acetyltransferase [unclassified Campylobacter]|uniref:GNAT family N-acetyltransferase n=1 Tax=unclassified Campylobacter TaxID=2593542 RepID=UPI0021E8240B|nr:MULTISPECIES: GNAT family N-acetyltransferase [unclassified Campylobacter]MCV3376779.1 GNAT family N-acetyltransferase [Campylobacter sp. IFREMER_LSEM_CL2194]MCV3402585.1 GNAT family N-acetyltransferase [Campylobacter sp. IFREMER_LSEM_CL2090]